jgi:hypothetical protein
VPRTRLLLPGLELIYLWNGFSVLGRKYALVERLYVAVQVSTRLPAAPCTPCAGGGGGRAGPRGPQP